MNFLELDSNFKDVCNEFLIHKAKEFGLNFEYIKELPDDAREQLWQLDQLGTMRGNEWVSMLRESMISAVWIQNNGELIQKALGCSLEEAKQLQRGAVIGSLLSDLGKVESDQLTWFYRDIYFEPELVKANLATFLHDRYNVDKTYKLMELPYSVAMDFYHEYIVPMTKKDRGIWEQDRNACDNKMQKIGLEVHDATFHKFDESEPTIHDAMTGAHLIVLPDLFSKWGINKLTIERFVALNHHLSRAVIDGLPPKKSQIYLEAVLSGIPDSQKDLWLKAAILEEIIDMTVAAYVRRKREGDNFGVNAEERMFDNLIQSRFGDRITTIEMVKIHRLMEEVGIEGKIKNSLINYLKTIFPAKVLEQ